MRIIDTFCGSIVECPTNVIVNSSNSSVALGSGVSASIRDTCGGSAFQQECREALEIQRGGDYLPQGEVIVTSGGTSTYRWIFHAASIDYTKGRYALTVGVRNCMLNSLKAAERIIEEQGLDGLSLGVPLFGSDVGGLSVKQSCDAICEGMKIYFRGCRDSLINKIRFVHPDAEISRQIQLILNSHFVLK